MSSRLQLDMRNLSLGRRHLVNAYEVEAGIGVIAGNTVWSMPERLECEVLQKARYINTLTFTFTSSAVFAVRCCHAVFVCVCPRRSYILPKQINISSKIFHHRVATPF